VRGSADRKPGVSVVAQLAGCVINAERYASGKNGGQPKAAQRVVSKRRKFAAYRIGRITSARFQIEQMFHRRYLRAARGLKNLAGGQWKRFGRYMDYQR
jgi:hypothetical protein